MKFSTLLSILMSAIFALVAVFGMRTYLRGQEDAIRAANQKEVLVAENTLVVAAQPLRFGNIIEPSSLRIIDWPNDSIPDGAFRTVEELIGESGDPRYVMSAIETAEPVLTSKITGPGQRATLSAALTTGMKAVSIRVNDVLGVSGFVLPGDRVDIMLTREVRKDEITTDVLLQGVKVLAVDQTADDRTQEASVVKTVTFEVSTNEAQKLTLAQTVGKLSLALRNIASSDVETIEPIRVSDLGGGATSQALIQEQIKSENDERLANIERLVRKVDAGVDERVEKLKQELAEDTERKLEAQTAVAAPPPILKPLVPSPPVNSNATVGVYRDSKRLEYTVKGSLN